ncbi:MAG TPA: hypothetical protein VKR79_01095 [Gaiellaceae bacterium]|nr:hypothetical protein [Gaiellaceae bacterium]
MGSRLLPLTLVAIALLAGAAGLEGLALWIGLLAVPAAAGAAFVAVSDALEGRTAPLQAAANAVALVLLVLDCAVRSNTTTGAAVPRLATWTLFAVLLAYSAPVVAWVLEPVKVTRRRPERRRRHVVFEDEDVLSRAA